MRKYICCTIGVVLIFLLVIILILFFNKKENQDTMNTSTENSEENSGKQDGDNGSVQDKISTCMESDEFKKGGIKDRAELIEKLMEEFIEKGDVEKYTVDLETDMPYVNCYLKEGGYFAIFLKKFPKDQN